MHVLDGGGDDQYMCWMHDGWGHGGTMVDGWGSSWRSIPTGINIAHPQHHLAHPWLPHCPLSRRRLRSLRCDKPSVEHDD